MKMEPSGWQCERKTTQMSSPATFPSHVSRQRFLLFEFIITRAGTEF